MVKFKRSADLLSEPVLGCNYGKFIGQSLLSAYFPASETHELFQLKRRLLEGIAYGEKAVEQRRTMSHACAKRHMVRWLK